MAEGIGTCKKDNEEELLQSIGENSRQSASSFYKTPSENSKFYGLESHFNNDVIFYKDVTVHGNLNYNFIQSEIASFQDLVVVGPSTFFGFADFYDGVYIDEDLNVAGVVTARQRLDVGCGGTTLTANTLTSRVGIATTNPQQTLDVKGTAIVSERIGVATTNPQETLDVKGTAIVSERVGIGSENPQQRVDVAGSIKIDENIYDSKNTPAKNGYFLTRDQSGIRWLPLVAEARPEVPGIGTDVGTNDGIFVLDEMVPLYP